MIGFIILKKVDDVASGWSFTECCRNMTAPMAEMMVNHQKDQTHVGDCGGLWGILPQIACVWHEQGTS